MEAIDKLLKKPLWVNILTGIGALLVLLILFFFSLGWITGNGQTEKVAAVKTLTLGSHGDTMVPVPSRCTVDGKLDMARYKQLAASQGMTPEMFEMQVRADLSNRQVIQGVQASAYATSAQTQTAMNAFMQSREVQKTS